MKIIFAILFLSTFPASVFGQTPPKTVTDFYLALPDNLSDIAGASRSDLPNFEGSLVFSPSEKSRSQSASDKFRKSLIKVEDVKNGYLYLEGMWEGWAEIALFRKADGTYLVAVSQVGCGPGCAGDLMFLAYEKGRWTNVTRRVFPAASSGDYYFKLPRAGTTVEQRLGEDCGADEECESRQKAAEFKWDRTKFVQREPAK